MKPHKKTQIEVWVLVEVILAQSYLNTIFLLKGLSAIAVLI